MKRREIKFVAGSLQLAPDRIEATPALRKPAAGRRRGRKATESQAPTLTGRALARKRR